MSEETKKVRLNLSEVKERLGKNMTVREMRELEQGFRQVTTSSKMVALFLEDEDGNYLEEEEALEIIDDMTLAEFEELSLELQDVFQGEQEKKVPRTKKRR